MGCTYTVWIARWLFSIKVIVVIPVRERERERERDLSPSIKCMACETSSTVGHPNFTCTACLGQVFTWYCQCMANMEMNGNARSARGEYHARHNLPWTSTGRQKNFECDSKSPCDSSVIDNILHELVGPILLWHPQETFRSESIFN